MSTYDTGDHRSTKARRGIAVLVAAVAFTAAACGSGGGQSASASGMQTVKLAVTASSLETVIYAIAQHEGTFAKHHINVQLTKIESGQESIAMQQLIQGAVDFTMTAAADPVTADSSFASQGGATPLRIVAAGGGTTNVVVAPKVNYTGLDSLRGLTLAVTNPTANHRIQFEYYLNQHHTSSKQLGIKFVTVSSADMPAALASGQIDGFVHTEPTTSLAVQKDNAKVAFNVTGIAQQAAAQALATRTSYIQSNRQTVQDVVDALQDASTDFSTMSKSTVVGIYTSWLGADPTLMTSIYDKKATDPRMSSLHQAADAFWVANRPSMVTQGTIGKNITEKDLFDYSFSK